MRLGDGTGPLKLREVRGATFYLLYRSSHGLTIPGLPRFITPLVIQVAIRGAVEFVIALVNSSDPDRSLWRSAVGVAAMRQTRKPRRPILTFYELLNRAGEWFVNLVIAWAFRPPTMSLSVRRKVEAIARGWDAHADSDRPPIQQIGEHIVAVLQWFGTHGHEMRAAVDALSIAIHWTADLSAASEAERRQVIEGALILYFEDRGVGGPYFRFMLRVVLDIALDAVIHLYRKRR